MFNVLEETSFADLFRRYRLLAGFSTLSSLADALADEGLQVDESILSRWQTGDRIPSRDYLLTVLKVFFQKKGIKNQTQANKILEAGGYGYLTDSEVKNIFDNYLFCSLPIFNSQNLNASLLTDAPTIIAVLRQQGRINEAQTTILFFLRVLQEENLLSVCERDFLITKLHTLWALVLGSYVYDCNLLQLFKKISQIALTMAKDINCQELIYANIHNLAVSHYVSHDWDTSEQLLKSNISKVQDPFLRVDMLVILLIDAAQLGKRQDFNYWRKKAEILASEIMETEIYYGESLYEAISRGLAILGEIEESRKIEKQVKFDKIRPFFESQMIRHPLIAYHQEALRGKLVDPHHIQDLIQRAKKTELQVFHRHQYQIKELVSQIRKLQPQAKISFTQTW